MVYPLSYVGQQRKSQDANEHQEKKKKKMQKALMVLYLVCIYGIYFITSSFPAPFEGTVVNGCSTCIYKGVQAIDFDNDVIGHVGLKVFHSAKPCSMFAEKPLARQCRERKVRRGTGRRAFNIMLEI